MKKYLLPNTGNFYKVNLHNHTMLSDGSATPEQTKALYKSLGYSAVAFTDHDVFIPHNDLTDSEFIALNGFEMEFADRYECYEKLTPWDRVKQCHLCFIAKNDKMDIQPFPHRSNRYAVGNKEAAKLAKYDENEEDFERWYSPKCINYVIREAKKRGFFVTYNHPTWSLEEYPDYTAYNGIDALEIMNGALRLGNPEYNPIVYDDMLRCGKRLGIVASDDGHQSFIGTYSDIGVCWTMIKADTLSYDSLIDGLEKGNYYASEGPEIHDLYVEDGVLKIKCSPAQKITVNYDACAAHIKLIEDGNPIESAEFTLRKDCGYFRVTVIGLNGKKACTNAYYPEEVGL
ncbi:MAG: PHP domain-containing protein [Clostridia bacterium]|nr:PHP domain-containing protein [Clostridia bacterium]